MCEKYACIFRAQSLEKFSQEYSIGIKYFFFIVVFDFLYIQVHWDLEWGFSEEPAATGCWCCSLIKSLVMFCWLYHLFLFMWYSHYLFTPYSEGILYSLCSPHVHYFFIAHLNYETLVFYLYRVFLYFVHMQDFISSNGRQIWLE